MDNNFVNLVIDMRKAQNDYFKKGRNSADLIRSKKLELLVDQEAARLKEEMDPADGPVAVSVTASMIGFLLQLKPMLNTDFQQYADYMIQEIKKSCHE